MKKFSKIVAGIMLASMTMLCAGASAEETQYKDPNVYGALYFAQDIEKATEGYAQDGYKPPVYFDDLNSMVLALRAKKIDVIEDLPQPVAEYICNRNQDMQITENLDEQWRGSVICRMGVAKYNDEVYELLNSAIKELQESGKLDALQKKYVDAFVQKGKEPKLVTLPKFNNTKTLKVAVTGDYPPIDMVTADGSPVGFNVAVLAEIAKLKKVNFILVPVNSGARFICLTKKIVDVVFDVDKAIYNNSEGTDFWANIHTPNAIKPTDIYAKYQLKYVVRK